MSRKLTGKHNMLEFMFSNAAGLRTPKDIFSDRFLELSEEVISRAIVHRVDRLHLTAIELADILSLNFSIIHFSYLKLFADYLSSLSNSYLTLIIKFY